MVCCCGLFSVRGEERLDGVSEDLLDRIWRGVGLRVEDMGEEGL